MLNNHVKEKTSQNSPPRRACPDLASGGRTNPTYTSPTRGGILSIIFCSIFIFLSFSPVLAQGDFGLTETADSAGLGSYPKDVSVIAGNAIGTALSLIAVLFFGLMIYGGFRWMLSRGEEDEAKKALDTIFAAIIGMVVVLAAYAITNFVFGAVGKAKPTPKPDPSAQDLGLEDAIGFWYCPSSNCAGESVLNSQAEALQCYKKLEDCNAELGVVVE